MPTKINKDTDASGLASSRKYVSSDQGLSKQSRLTHLMPKTHVEAALVSRRQALAVVGAGVGLTASEVGRWTAGSHSGTGAGSDDWVIS